MMCVGILASLLVWRLTHQPPPPKVGAHAPPFSLHRLTGDGTLSLASLRGRPVVLNFFASSCAPCKAEAGVLEAAFRQYHSNGAVFVGIDYQDATSDARRFVQAHGVTYPVVRDPGQVAAEYGIMGTPETFFINRDGRLVDAPVVGTVVNQRSAFERGVQASLS
jgi:cytochrome c biogenesis protein CcmG, thiol:disulfide interchange protein DsbE